jgi:hypothetical protein
MTNSHRILSGPLHLAIVAALYGAAALAAPPGHVTKHGMDVDLRSSGRQIADEVAAFGNSAPQDAVSPISGQSVGPQVKLKRGNVQANEAALDNIQDFGFTRPFISYTQSETSIAASGPNIVATYNNSADQPVVEVQPGVLVYAHRFLSGYSVSSDSGKTWASGSMPPVAGSIFTFGDPSVGVDRKGNFYFAGLGANAAGQTTIQVNKSIDGGRSWSDATVVQQDNGGDKEWLAVGPDPFQKSRDNVYVTWTSFQPTGGAQLRFGRTTDGGATWESKTIFAPTPDPDDTRPQNSLQFSNPAVDRVTGTLYVPFARFSNADQDFLQILVSKDAGQTFSFINFNIPGAPDSTLLPLVQPGHLMDCGANGGFRLAIHAGLESGGRFGLPTYIQASRLTVQPAFAARNGVLYLAWSQSTSPFFGDPTSNTNIMFMRSDDGGTTWSAPVQVNPDAATDTQHVLPALSIDSDPNDVHVAYYTQHTDGTIDVDMANSHDRGVTFPVSRVIRVSSQSTALAPTNIPLSPPSGGTFSTTNYDRTIRPCYNLGEYLGVDSANGTVHALWGDSRNSVTHPVNGSDPLSGQTHPQQDVFYQAVKAQ